MEKKCTKCNEVKNFSEFYKDKSKKDGLGSQCKSCKKEYYKANADKIKKYQKANAEKRKEYYKKYQKANADKIKEYRKEYLKVNSDKIKKYQKANAEKIKKQKKEYYKANADKIKEYYKANADKIKKQKKEYYKANADKIKEYKKANADKLKEYKKKYIKNKLKKDPVFKFKKKLRGNIYKTFKRACNGVHVKKSKSLDILGCDMEFFMRYISSKFQKGMTFENYGEWHLDHIIPISKAETEEDIIRLNHYTNFQPLWAEDNRKKLDKIIEQQLTLL